jgi:spore germination cell wall hydrolase CwlJ-like protein
MLRREDFQFFAVAMSFAISLHACDWLIGQGFTTWTENVERSVPVEQKYVPAEPVIIPATKVVAAPVMTNTSRLQRCKRSGECSKMAEALVYEARGETLVGAVAVGYVILERTKNPSKWPKTIRGVVSQRNQFSYTTRKQKVRPKQEDWERAFVTSYRILHGEVKNPIKTSDHYHTLKVKPRWAKKMQYVATVGSHKFYKDHE